VTVHLIVALVIVSLLLYSTVYAFFATRAGGHTVTTHRGTLAWSALALILVTLAQVAIGAQVRGSVDQAMDAGTPRTQALASVGAMDAWHRDAALVVFVGSLLLMLVVWSRHPHERPLLTSVYAVVGFVLLQIAIGLVMAYVALAPAAQVAHLTASSLLLGAETVLFLLARWLPADD
jgi:cytochrome c oxidase assembly protein subunit 15